MAAIVTQVEIAKVDTVDGDLAFVGVVGAGDELGHAALPSTGAADEG